MRVFERLRALRAFENQHALFLRTGGNHHLIGEIGHHQAKGKPLTLKQLILLDIGSVATVQRHLRRLKELGLVQHRRAASDRRAVELTLTPKCARIFLKYDTLMTLPPVREATRQNGESRHLCALCDSDAGSRSLLAKFFADGLKRGDKCVLVAPAEVQNEVLAELTDRRKAPRHLVVSEGYDSCDAQLAFYRRVAREARQAGQNLCIAGPVAWALARNMQVDAILNYEKRVDALARQLSLRVLCVYDARHVSSGDFLRTVKCHRDHARYPIVLG